LVTGWTADSDAVLFDSNRNGKWAIFRKAIGEEAPKVVISGAWALSFDSTKIAIVDRSAHARMLYVADARVVSLPVRGEKWGQLQTVGLSADGSLIFATAWSDGSNALISIDSLGNPQVLEQVHGSQAWLCCPVPSPNGRFLAFEKRTYENNVVMLENF